MTSELVLRAIAAIKAGDKHRARKLLVEAIRQNNRDDNAWLVLAAVVPEEEQVIECLERALKINPQNEKAKFALANYKPPSRKSLPLNKILLGSVIAVITLVVAWAFTAVFGNITKNRVSPVSTPLTKLDVQSLTTVTKETPTLEQPTSTSTKDLSTSTPVLIYTQEAIIPVGFTCIPSTMPISGEVINVVDGDNIEVLIGDKVFSVRYIGIDSPEINEPYGDQAYQYNHTLVNEKQVDMYYDVSETDRYGRLLFYVFVGDTFVNYELVRSGYAFAKDYPPDTACSDTFHEATNIAKQAALGIWALTPKRSPTTKLVAPPSPGNVPASCTCKPPDLDCADFGTHKKAQTCFEYCKSLGKGDYYRLDGDSDGVACERLP